MLDNMKVVGTFFSAEEAREVAGLLEARQVFSELRTITDESGLETIELLADDAYYEVACDVVENRQAAQAAASQEKEHKRIRCVKCGSSQWERVEDPGYTQNGLIVMRCKDCGCVFTRYGYRIAQ
jgi:hypothetical protein